MSGVKGVRRKSGEKGMWCRKMKVCGTENVSGVKGVGVKGVCCKTSLVEKVPGVKGVWCTRCLVYLVLVVLVRKQFAVKGFRCKSCCAAKDVW